MKRKRVEESSKVICDGKVLMDPKTKIAELRGPISANTKAKIKRKIENFRFILQSIELDVIENTRQRDKFTNRSFRDIGIKAEPSER